LVYAPPVPFTDIADSTRRAAEMRDPDWLDAHDAVVSGATPSLSVAVR
jgi:hypothetical protein